jgi:hypothetical protein
MFFVDGHGKLAESAQDAAPRRPAPASLVTLCLVAAL